MISKFVIKRRQKDDAWDVSKLVTNVKWTTDMNYSAGELDFDIQEVEDGFGIKNGDTIMFDWNGKHIFKGFVFKYEFKKGKQYSVTAYDSLRYFKNTDNIVFNVSTLKQRFDRVCKYLNVPHKTIRDPKHKLSSEVENNKSYFSMLQDAIERTYLATGERYFLRDNYGTVELRQYPHLELNTIIGDQSLLTDYSLERSIEQSANIVRVTKSSVKNGKQQMITEQAQANNIGRWGKLVYVEQTAKKLNAAQMKELAKQTLKTKNKQSTKLKITAIGNVDLQAGNSVIVNIKDLKDINVGSKRYLIKKAVHTFGSDYSVSLDMEW